MLSGVVSQASQDGFRSPTRRRRGNFQKSATPLLTGGLRLFCCFETMQPALSPKSSGKVGRTSTGAALDLRAFSWALGRHPAFDQHGPGKSRLELARFSPEKEDLPKAVLWPRFLVTT